MPYYSKGGFEVKKLKLCYECGVVLECDKHCKDAVDFEKQDNSDNYIKEGYKIKGIARTWTEQKRILNNEEFGT